MAGEPEPRQPLPRRGLGLGAFGVEDLEPQPHVVDRVAPRHQPVVLEHDADLAAKEVELVERIVADHTDLPAGRLDQAGSRLNMVDLPQPVLPSTATISPLAMSKERRSTAVNSAPPSGGGTPW